MYKEYAHRDSNLVHCEHNYACDFVSIGNAMEICALHWAYIGLVIYFYRNTFDILYRRRPDYLSAVPCTTDNTVDSNCALVLCTIFFFYSNDLQISALWRLVMAGVLFVVNTMDALIRLCTENVNLTVNRFGRTLYIGRGLCSYSSASLHIGR